MFVEIAFADEASVTDRADMGFLPSMKAFVPLSVTSSTETLVTELARVGLLSCVNALVLH